MLLEENSCITHHWTFPKRRQQVNWWYNFDSTILMPFSLMKFWNGKTELKLKNYYIMLEENLIYKLHYCKWTHAAFQMSNRTRADIRTKTNPSNLWIISNSPPMYNVLIIWFVTTSAHNTLRIEHQVYPQVGCLWKDRSVTYLLSW